MPSSSTEECAANEEYLICGSACPFNCTDPEGPVVCEEDCVEGCFCKNGYLRDVNGSCVPADQCVGEPSICSPNEEFLSCGSACPLTCAQPERAPCGLACSVGCFCKAGYVRDEKSNKCVTLDQCPVGKDAGLIG
ncbi:serine protease inhibitor swm-1-like [Plutella xylostella]|uniref:serine protease inhibitor swm-1-like n=1 Tax=Plutella xylostella TaxID=51655 RepID=UPI00203295D0|nr:serine protease inhibitor swm-1-like [Plutella xylostella]